MEPPIYDQSFTFSVFLKVLESSILSASWRCLRRGGRTWTESWSQSSQSQLSRRVAGRVINLWSWVCLTLSSFSTSALYLIEVWCGVQGGEVEHFTIQGFFITETYWSKYSHVFWTSLYVFFIIYVHFYFSKLCVPAGTTSEEGVIFVYGAFNGSVSVLECIVYTTAIFKQHTLKVLEKYLPVYRKVDKRTMLSQVKRLVKPHTAVWILINVLKWLTSLIVSLWFRSWPISSSCVRLDVSLALCWVQVNQCGCTYLTTPLRITDYGRGWPSVTIMPAMGRSFRSCSTRLLRRTSVLQLGRVVWPIRWCVTGARSLTLEIRTLTESTRLSAGSRD